MPDDEKWMGLDAHGWLSRLEEGMRLGWELQTASSLRALRRLRPGVADEQFKEEARRLPPKPQRPPSNLPRPRFRRSRR